MGKRMLDGKTRETFETKEFVYTVFLNRSAGKYPVYDIIEAPKYKSKNKLQMIGHELPYHQCLQILRKRKGGFRSQPSENAERWENRIRSNASSPSRWSVRSPGDTAPRSNDRSEACAITFPGSRSPSTSS